MPPYVHRYGRFGIPWEMLATMPPAEHAAAYIQGKLGSLKYGGSGWVDLRLFESPMAQEQDSLQDRRHVTRALSIDYQEIDDNMLRAASASLESELRAALGRAKKMQFIKAVVEMVVSGRVSELVGDLADCYLPSVTGATIAQMSRAEHIIKRVAGREVARMEAVSEAIEKAGPVFVEWYKSNTYTFSARPTPNPWARW